MEKMILGLCMMSLLLTGVMAQSPKKITTAQLNEDFIVFRQALKEAHPGLYRYNTKEKIDAAFDELEQQLRQSEMTELELYQQLMPFLAKIKCGHTKFHRYGRPDDEYLAFSNQRLFPVKLSFQRGKAFDSNGKEVLRINGRKMSSIITLLFRNMLTDGDSESAKYQELNQHFAGYYATFIDTPETFRIGYQFMDIDLPAVSQLARKTIIPEPPFSLSFPAKDVALIRISSFQTPYEDFLKTTFQKLKSQQTAHLIIDLRDNEGGTNRFGLDLFAWLAKAPFRYYDRLTVAGTAGPYSFAQHAVFPPQMESLKQYVKQSGNEYLFTLKEGLGLQQPQPDAYTGNLYILQNGRSFSVSAEFAAIVKDNKRAVFIGEESGGAMQGNNSGGFAFVTLPNSRLQLDIPLLGYYMHIKNEAAGNGGVPVDYTVSDNEEVLQKTLRIISGRK